MHLMKEINKINSREKIQPKKIININQNRKIKYNKYIFNIKLQ